MDALGIDNTMELKTPRSSSNTPDATSQLNHVANNDSPLMKLVDAALGPNSPVHDSEATVHESSDSKKGKGHADDEAESRNNESKPSVTDDDKVIRGTIHDLVARQEKKATFAEFLMQCLNDEANSDVIGWMPCGTQFTITNHRKFTMERMPQLFNIRNMSSFVRKLTRWGFSRVHEKATGNSDIFKHPYFLRDKQELCKKIRCVSRSPMDDTKGPPSSMEMRMGPSMMMMGNFSESSNRHCGLEMDQDLGLHLGSPRRSIGHSVPLYQGRTPPAETSRFHPGNTPRGSTSYLPPRISPEAEREMMERTAFHAQLSPPQVYSSPMISRTMSAAAEYELEQVLLERQRARMMRNEQNQHIRASQQPQYNRGRHMEVPPLSSRIHTVEGSRVAMQPPRMPLESGSERSMDSFSDRRYNDNVQGFYGSASDNNAVTAALEKMSREGEYDLDMSPREAMLRAVLHKRQQQKALQSHAIPFGEASPPNHGPSPGRHPSYFR